MVVAAVIGFRRLASGVRRARAVCAVVAGRGVTVASGVGVSHAAAVTGMTIATGRARRHVELHRCLVVAGMREPGDLVSLVASRGTMPTRPIRMGPGTEGMVDLVSVGRFGSMAVHGSAGIGPVVVGVAHARCSLRCFAMVAVGQFSGAVASRMCRGEDQGGDSERRHRDRRTFRPSVLTYLVSPHVIGTARRPTS